MRGQELRITPRYLPGYHWHLGCNSCPVGGAPHWVPPSLWQSAHHSLFLHQHPQQWQNTITVLPILSVPHDMSSLLLPPPRPPKEFELFLIR